MARPIITKPEIRALTSIKTQAEVSALVSSYPVLKIRNVRVEERFGTMGKAPKMSVVISQYVPRSCRRRKSVIHELKEGPARTKLHAADAIHLCQILSSLRSRRHLSTHGPAKETRYLMKFGERHYPVESITEHLFTRLGMHIGLEMAETELATIGGRLVLLSKVFLSRQETLIHGAQILEHHLMDKAFLKSIPYKKAREYIHLADIEEAITNVYPEEHRDLVFGFHKILLFDAWTGCHDRHLFNWGVIETPHKRKRTARIAPCYDSARGLFWREQEATLKRKYHGPNNHARRKKYIIGSKPEIGVTGRSGDQFDLVHEILRTADTPIAGWARQTFTDDVISCAIARVKAEFKTSLTQTRIECIESILSERLQILKAIIPQAP